MSDPITVIWIFTCIGSQQTWTALLKHIYKIDTWGDNGGSDAYSRGSGGYAYCYVKITSK